MVYIRRNRNNLLAPPSPMVSGLAILFVAQGQEVLIGMADALFTLPLGWMLSRLAQRDLSRQLVDDPEKPPSQGPRTNVHKLKWVLVQFRGDAGPGRKEMACW